MASSISCISTPGAPFLLPNPFLSDQVTHHDDAVKYPAANACSGHREVLISFIAQSSSPQPEGLSCMIWGLGRGRRNQHPCPHQEWNEKRELEEELLPASTAQAPQNCINFVFIAHLSHEVYQQRS